MSDATREQMLAEAIRKHDLAFGTAHCDRKYILSCSELPRLILQTRLACPLCRLIDGHAPDCLESLADPKERQA